jgi:hypothetical protein
MYCVYLLRERERSRGKTTYLLPVRRNRKGGHGVDGGGVGETVVAESFPSALC